MSGTKPELRQRLRAARRTLQSQTHHQHSTQLLHNVHRTLMMLRFRNFALYLPADGEIDTWPLINKLLACERQVGLPCLRKHATGHWQMRFARYTQKTPLIPGHYDLLEPQAGVLQHRPFVPDVLLMPLVGFDSAGQRLGMGGGFYDGYNGPLERATPALRIGLAHELQALPNDQRLPVDSWDKPLDGVITEQRVRSFTPRGKLCLGA